VTTDPGVVTSHGLSSEPPKGWDVRIFRRQARPPETTHPVLHAATFPMPAQRGDYGDGAVQLIGRGDVFVALVEFGASSVAQPLFAGRGFPAPLGPADFSRTSLQVSIAGQAGVQRWFVEEGRAWCLYVVIGSWDDRSRLADRANRLIAGIRVHA
jgi:hypothetical protein